MRIGEFDFERTRYGMLRQKNPRSFRYDSAYLERQSTTVEMSYLRLGYLLSQVSFDRLRSSQALELGPGRGVFFDVLKPHVRSLQGCDAVPESPYHTIDWEQAKGRCWDIVVAFDVLEHFEEIDRLWELSFEFGYLSLPAPPKNGISPEWRHFKPDEHIWHMTAEQFSRWAADAGYETIASGTPEDCIRTRWDEQHPNINSFIIRRAG